MKKTLKERIEARRQRKLEAAVKNLTNAAVFKMIDFDINVRRVSVERAERQHKGYFEDLEPVIRRKVLEGMAHHNIVRSAIAELYPTDSRYA